MTQKQSSAASPRLLLTVQLFSQQDVSPPHTVDVRDHSHDWVMCMKQVARLTQTLPPSPAFRSKLSHLSFLHQSRTESQNQIKTIL